MRLRAPFADNFKKVCFVAGLFMLAVALLYFHNLGGWLLEDDEGTDLYEIWRISEGDVPGVDVITAQPPVFLLGGVSLGRVADFNVTVLRGASAVLVLGSAWFVFLLGREIWNPRVGFLGMIFYLLNHLVYKQARLFRPDPWMLAFSVLGLYFFVLAQTKARRWTLSLAGVAYSVATLCKLFGVLPLGGCFLFLAFRALAGRSSLRRFLGNTVLLLAPFLLMTVAGIMAFYPPGSAYYGTVLGQHWQLGSQRGLIHRPLKGAIMMAFFLIQNAAFLFTIPLLHRLSVSHKAGEGVLAWQVPSGLAYLALSRPIFARYWLYLVPVFGLLLGYLVDRLLRRMESRRGSRTRLLVSLAGVLLVCLGVIQSVPAICQRARLYEEDTRALASYIANNTSPHEVVLSDYAGLNFYARRPSVPQASIIAGGRIEGGFITGAGLITEIEKRDVVMVLLHVSGRDPHHLVKLHDFDEFYTYLNQHFCFVSTFDRAGQIFEIYQSCSGQTS